MDLTPLLLTNPNPHHLRHRLVQQRVGEGAVGLGIHGVWGEGAQINGRG